MSQDLIIVVNFLALTFTNNKHFFFFALFLTVCLCRCQSLWSYSSLIFFQQTKDKQMFKTFLYSVPAWTPPFLFWPQAPLLSPFKWKSQHLLSRVSLIQNIAVHKEEPRCQMLYNNYIDIYTLELSELLKLDVSLKQLRKWSWKALKKLISYQFSWVMKLWQTRNICGFWIPLYATLMPRTRCFWFWACLTLGSISDFGCFSLNFNLQQNFTFI